MNRAISKIILVSFLVVSAALSACEKTHLDETCNINMKWQLVAKSGDGVNWQHVAASDVHTLEFSNTSIFLFSTNTSSCSGTYTLTGDELVTDLGNCSQGMYFSHHVMLQNATTMVLRPNSGATLPYVKYVKIK